MSNPNSPGAAAIFAALAALAALAFGAVVVTSSRDSARAQDRPAAPAPPGAGGDVRTKAAARVEAAQKLVEAIEKTQTLGQEPLTPSFVELKGLAHRRLADARIDAAGPDDRAARVRAAEEYAKQCRDFL